VGSVALLGALAAIAVARASDSVQRVEVRVAAIGLLALVAALVLGWTPLIPVSIVVVGGGYAAQLAIDDAALDTSVPVVAAGLLVAAELAYWSLEERDRVQGDGGDRLRRVVFVAGLGLGALLVGSVLLALVDAVSTTGLAVDMLGSAAAAITLFAIVLATRGHDRARH
jgi:hypothetical protein